jgi:asparagine synthase (glutamine-hydrolysing)
MCGIVGISLKNSQVDQAALKRATALLHHRGPDSSNTYTSANGKTGLGHTRLSFLDLSSAGLQPLSNDDKTISVVLNGEIYNYLELREELVKLGFHFKTQTDTEILIHGWKKWGEQLPEKLEGMFALAIFDENLQQLFLARDRFGIKPLYYVKDPNEFIFASEIKSILALDPGLKKIRPQSISLFLANRYVPTPHTIWQNIFKLEPGHSLKVDLNTLQIHNKSYWELYVKSKVNTGESVYEEFRNHLKESLSKHLRSDVPIGSFLSGGLDSSSLVYLMQKELGYETNAFAIGFEDWDQSEDLYAKMVAESVGAKLHVAKPKELHLESVEKLMWHYDDPIADISIIPTFEVSGLAGQHVKAVVSGEGADEMLGGYWWHKPESLRYKNRLREIFGTYTFEEIKHHYIHAMSMGLFDHTELTRALSGDYQKYIPEDPFEHFDQFKLEDSTKLRQLQFLDLKTFMPELILTKVDRASMAHSLEVRVPFLQHQLVEFMFSLDEKTFFKKREQKPFLKKLLKGNIPDLVINRPKQGFVGPDKYYMNMEVYRTSLLNGHLVQNNVVKQEYIDQKLKEKDHWRLWKLFVLENWWKNWM